MNSPLKPLAAPDQRRSELRNVSLPNQPSFPQEPRPGGLGLSSAPPIYRGSGSVQPKFPGPGIGGPPPVYRPPQTHVAGPVSVAASPEKHSGLALETRPAPPLYRPQVVPARIQAKVLPFLFKSAVNVVASSVQRMEGKKNPDPPRFVPRQLRAKPVGNPTIVAKRPISSITAAETSEKAQDEPEVKKVSLGLEPEKKADPQAEFRKLVAASIQTPPGAVPAPRAVHPPQTLSGLKLIGVLSPSYEDQKIAAAAQKIVTKLRDGKLDQTDLDSPDNRSDLTAISWEELGTKATNFLGTKKSVAGQDRVAKDIGTYQGGTIQGSVQLVYRPPADKSYGDRVANLEIKINIASKWVNLFNYHLTVQR